MSLHTVSKLRTWLITIRSKWGIWISRILATRRAKIASRRKTWWTSKWASSQDKEEVEADLHQLKTIGSWRKLMEWFQMCHVVWALWSMFTSISTSPTLQTSTTIHTTSMRRSLDKRSSHIQIWASARRTSRPCIFEKLQSLGQVEEDVLFNDCLKTRRLRLHTVICIQIRLKIKEEEVRPTTELAVILVHLAFQISRKTNFWTRKAQVEAGVWSTMRKKIRLTIQGMVTSLILISLGLKASKTRAPLTTQSRVGPSSSTTVNNSNKGVILTSEWTF